MRATGLSDEELAQRLLRQERIAVMLGERFGAGAASHGRVALTEEDRAFEEAFSRLLALGTRLAAETARAIPA